MSMDEKKKSHKRRILWLLVLILFISVSITTFTVVQIMNMYQPDDNGSISLRPDGPEDGNGPTSGDNTGTTDPVPTEPPVNPGFESADDETAWETKTQIELFKVSYENGEQKVTVVSSNGDKIIAPGSKNSYVFKLKNTGNVALDYTVEIEAYFNISGVEIPITARLCRYDGNWILGNKNAYANFAEGIVISDAEVLGAGKYTYYTLDWLWPFDGEDDTLDTMLGDLSSGQELTFTIVISTCAEESADPNAQGGLTPPKTGDDFNITFWVALIAGSLIIIIILLIIMKRESKPTDAEAKKLEGTQRE